MWHSHCYWQNNEKHLCKGKKHFFSLASHRHFSTYIFDVTNFSMVINLTTALHTNLWQWIQSNIHTIGLKYIYIIKESILRFYRGKQLFFIGNIFFRVFGLSRDKRVTIIQIFYNLNYPMTFLRANRAEKNILNYIFMAFRNVYVYTKGVPELLGRLFSFCTLLPDEGKPCSKQPNNRHKCACTAQIHESDHWGLCKSVW